MKRLLLLTVIAAIAVSAVALIGVRSSGGSADKASAQVAQIVLDLDPAGGWCTTIQSTGTATTGLTDKAAICLTGSAVGAANFNIDVNYTSAGTGKNSCTSKNQTGTGLDANPDFIVTTGSGWDCSSSGNLYPKCGETVGVASITCGSLTPGTPTGNWAIAEITWTADNAGTDTLSFGTTALYDTAGGEIVKCANTPENCLGATIEKSPPVPTATATALPSECDIGAVAPGIVAKVAGTPVAALTMKVGDPPTKVDLTASFQNNGRVTALAPEAVCSFARVVTAQIGTGDTYTDSRVDPTQLGVRVEPYGSLTSPYGDVCLMCNPYVHPPSSGWTTARCVQDGQGIGSYYPTPAPGGPTYPNWDYIPIPCDEAPNPSGYPVSIFDESCEDGIDQQAADPVVDPPDPSKDTCDWGGFSLSCTPPAEPDPRCVDVPLIGLVPFYRAVLAPHVGTSLVEREVKVECRARGTFPLVLAAGVGKTSTSVMPPGPYMAPSHDPNATNDTTFTIVTVTCTKGPEMVKDCNTATESIDDSCNLWLMDPNFPGKMLPEQLPAADDNGCVNAVEGKGCLAVDVWLKSADDEDDLNDSDTLKECLGAWEHQVRYDHKIIKFLNDLAPLVNCDTGAADPAGVPWLECEGRLISSVVGDPPVIVNECLTTVMSENWIIEGCVSKDGPDDLMQVGPCGDGIIEQMLIIPQYNDLVYRSAFRPTKDNGVVTNIVDDNCEITDIYAEPMADTLPGGLTPICGDLHITVRMLEGDIDLDCDVDVVDDQALAFRYGARWGMQIYDLWYDLEPKYSDDDIDIKDLQFVFGRNYSTCQAPIPDDQSIPVDPGQP